MHSYYTYKNNFKNDEFKKERRDRSVLKETLQGVDHPPTSIV